MKHSLIILSLVLLSSALLPQSISTSGWQKLVPSGHLPKNIRTRSSNNNLDLVKFNGRYYLAFRTAPTHFASKKTTLYIISSEDLQSWRLEQEIHHGYDLREPRFIVFNEKLFFYYFEGGRSPFRFEPRKVWVKTFTPAEGWHHSYDTGLDGYVPWRLRTQNGIIYLSAYYGRGLYSSGHSSDMRLFISNDGYQWKPLTEKSQVRGENPSEGEFIFDKEGNLWATVRLESEGALIAYAGKNDLGNWQVNYSKYKYDSALMFTAGNETYVVSRRNVDGTMAKAPGWFPKNLRKKYNLLKYWLTTKKTALFRLNKVTMELEHLIDFPSTGDTAYPGMVQIDENNFLLMNYSSNIYDKNRNWLAGQLGKTYIYWTVLSFRD